MFCKLFAVNMFFKHLITTGFHIHHFKIFLKGFLLNILKTFYHKHFLYPYFQTFANKDGGEQ